MKTKRQTKFTAADHLRFAVGPHVSGGVGIEFRRPISWIVLSKEEAIRMGFLLLEHAGAKVRPSAREPAAETPPDDHTERPPGGSTS